MKIFSLKNLVVLFYLALTISCNDDDDNAIPERIITFTAHDSDRAYWVLLSDDAGKTVAWKEIPNDTKQEIKYASVENVTVTVISKSTNGASLIQLKTFTHVENGDYSLGFADMPNNPSIVGSFLLTIPDTFGNSYPQSESNCGVNYGKDPVEMLMCESTSNLYLALYKNDNDTPHYYFDPEIHPGESLTVDDNFYNLAPLMKSKMITIGEPATGISLVEGNTINKKRDFLASIYFTSSSVSSIPIYYPDLEGALFSDFDFNIYYSNEKNVYNQSTKTSKEPADSYPPLDVNFDFSDSTKITTEALAFPVTGQAQYVLTSFNYYDSNTTLWWYIYTEFSNDISVKLPSFPDDLKKVVDLSAVNKLKKTQLNFVENNGLGGYSGFYKKQLRLNDRSSGPFDVREKIYKFNYGSLVMSGGRFSRKRDNFPATIE